MLFVSFQNKMLKNKYNWCEDSIRELNMQIAWQSTAENDNTFKQMKVIQSSPVRRKKEESNEVLGTQTGVSSCHKGC